MRRVGDLLRELGFNGDAPMSTQRAFLRHLERAATVTRGSESSVEVKPTAPSTSPASIKADAQLSFDPEILGTSTKNRIA
jgi:hypothetical protein